jgi:hypothetical protein
MGTAQGHLTLEVTYQDQYTVSDKFLDYPILLN